MRRARPPGTDAIRLGDGLSQRMATLGTDLAFAVLCTSEDACIALSRPLSRTHTRAYIHIHTSLATSSDGDDEVASRERAKQASNDYSGHRKRRVILVVTNGTY